MTFTHPPLIVPAHAVAPYYAQGAEPTPRHARVQQLVYALKDGRRWQDRSGNYRDPAEVIARYVVRHGSPVLGPYRVLVPMPRSSVTPKRVRASQWPALRFRERVGSEDFRRRFGQQGD